MPSPTKIVLERRVKPGEDKEVERWIHSLVASAEATHALEGTSVFAHDTERFILLRFRSADDLERWRSSAELGGLLTQVAASSHQIQTGLETWFTLPGHPTTRAAPPRWKMAALTWSALLPTVLVMGQIVPRFAPAPLITPISTACTVGVLTWILMPRLAKLAQRWLYRA